MPYKNAIDLCFFSVENNIFTTLVVDKGIHITLNAKTKKVIPSFVSGKKSIFSGPDADATIYFNKISKIKASDYNKKESKIVFHSKDTAPAKTQRLQDAFEEHLAKLDKYIAKHPSPYASIARQDDLASYYSRQLIINWNHPIDSSLFNKILSYNPSHSSMYTGNIYSYLYNRLFYGDKDAYDAQTKSTILSLIEPDQKEDFNVFYAEMRKKNKREKYDEKVYQDGKHKYLDTYEGAVYSAHLDGYLTKIKPLPIADLDKLLASSFPEANVRSIYLRKTKPLLTSDRAKDIYKAIELGDKKTFDQLLNMIVDTDEKFPLGNKEASNTKVSMYTADHDSLASMLEAIRSTYPGKVVILDIWGTWCGPCRNDIKKSKQKLAELKLNNVEVVYLCEGRNCSKAEWMEAVVKMDMTGNQILMSPSLSSQFLARFNITGYPSHVFIDTEGNYHKDKEHFIQNLDVNDVVKKYHKKE